MRVFVSVGILFLSVLIMSFLMLIPGVFANFCHYASGKYSRKKADDLTLFFILGVEAKVVIIFFLILSILLALPPLAINFENEIVSWVLAGIFLALGLSVLFFYFRREKEGSKLFIPRSVAQELLEKPKFIKKRSDAFIFGLISGIPELPFTLPLYVVSTLAILKIDNSPTPCSVIIIIFALITILPLIIIRSCLRGNHNLADYMRFRTKNKSFFRIFLSILYFLIAILIILFRIIY